MIGLYAMAVVLLWLWLTWLLLRRGWRALIRDKEKSALRIALWSIVILIWFGASLWYGGGRIIYYDWQVDRMCAVDGGVRVYETVALPVDKFDPWGMVNFYHPSKGENALGDEFRLERKTIYYIRGVPNLSRMHTKLIRQADGKVLGESVFYKRTGGDLPGPWYESSYMCPELSVMNDILRQVFIKE